jgi:hypothetical protein
MGRYMNTELYIIQLIILLNYYKKWFDTECLTHTDIYWLKIEMTALFCLVMRAARNCVSTKMCLDRRSKYNQLISPEEILNKNLPMCLVRLPFWSPADETSPVAIETSMKDRERQRRWEAVKSFVVLEHADSFELMRCGGTQPVPSLVACVQLMAPYLAIRFLPHHRTHQHLQVSTQFKRSSYQRMAVRRAMRKEKVTFTPRDK